MPTIPHNNNLSVPLQEMRAQWEHPGDALSVLLILGGDVIQRALAQLAGNWLTPLTFSFGWVAYSVSARVSAAGDNKLLPPPDCPAIVINGKTGYVRQNQSWIIGRLVRDYEYWMDRKVDLKLAEIVEEAKKHEIAKHSNQNATIDSALLKVKQTTLTSKAGPWG